MRSECNIRNGFSLTAIAQSVIGTTNVSRSCSGVTPERLRRLQVVALEKRAFENALPRSKPSFSPRCNIDMNTFAFLLAIQPAGVPVLRIAFTIALLLALGAGAFIYRRRDRLFGRDPEVVNDTTVVRHNRAEEIVFVLGGLTLAVLSVLYQLWFG
jgi:hypothetical protein